MLVGSKEWLAIEKNKSRTAIAGECEAINEDNTVWVAGIFITVITSKELMAYIKNKEHSEVLHFIKQNITEVDNYYKANPDKKPADHYVNFDYGYVTLDLATAGLVVKHYTGSIPDWEFIEQQD